MEMLSHYWPFVWESTGHRWIPLTNRLTQSIVFIFGYQSEQVVEHTVELPTIWDEMKLM